jgi:hypothetical protein
MNGLRLRSCMMTNPVDETIYYYDQHADVFAAQTAGLDLEPLYQRFLRHVRPRRAHS